MSEITSDISCMDCGRELRENEKCCGEKRFIQVKIRETLEVSEKVKCKKKDSSGKVTQKSYNKNGYYLKGGYPEKVERFIDKENNWYREHIKRSDWGITTKLHEEPLSQHRNKRNKKR